MEVLRFEQVVVEDGRMVLTDLPYKRGQRVEIIVFPQPTKTAHQPRLTAGQFRASGLIGLWRDHTDIADSAVYARQLREAAQNREGSLYDSAG